MTLSDVPAPALRFLDGGGAMGAAIRTHDWSATPLGAPGTWPQSLRTLVGVLLAAGQPMFLVWGEAGTMLFNDGYVAILGNKRDSALGRPFLDVWSEARDDLTPLVAQVFAGTPVSMDDLTLYLDRGAGPQEAHFAFSYTPVRDEHGAVVGLFCPCVETTAEVLAGRAQAVERDRQRALLQQMPGFVAVLAGPGHVYEYANDAYAEIAGRRTLVGRTVREALPELATQGYFELLDQVYASGEAYVAHSLPIHLEGEAEPRSIDLLFEPIRDDAGTVTGIFVGGYDVTDRVAAEAALIASEASSAQVLDATSEAFYAVDRAGLTTLCNAAFLAMLGFTREQVIGRALHDVIHHSHPDGTHYAREDCPIYRAAAMGATAHVSDELFFRADGSGFPVEYRAEPIRVGGVVTGAICTFSDITERKAQQAALATLNATLEQQVAERTADRDRIWRNSQDLLVVIDTQGNFRAVSPSVTKILGWTTEEMVGRPLFDFIVPEDEASTEGALDVATTRTLDVFENRYRHKEGGFRWLSWVATPEEGLIYATARHITAEKTAAIELLAMQEALRQSQKMEAVGQLTGGIAHDFNNMLAVVIGSLDLLGRRLGEGDARSKRYVDAATDGARRAALLTQRLLAFSRQQPLQPEAIDPNALVAGMSDLLRHSLGADVRLETVLTGGMWRAHVDPNQLENVILNLAVNARDAMPGGGRLTIETQNAHLDERYAAAHLGLPPGQYVLIAVSDTGDGMPADVIAKAFDPFFTTKAVGKGTGLGLSQVYGFVKQSGGHVKIYSEPGEGTTVKIYLPRLVGEAGDADVAAAAMAPPLGDVREVILVVDDEPAVRQFSVDALGELGYRVIAADGAASALRLLAAHPEIVLLFTDVIMPDVNGRKLADAALQVRPDLKVLFTTGYTRNAVVHNGVLDAGVELIGKPFSVDQLAAKVREVLDAV